MEFNKYQRGIPQPQGSRTNPSYVTFLMKLGVARNKAQAGYILLGIVAVCILGSFFLWPEENYSGPDPSGLPDPTTTR